MQSHLNLKVNIHQSVCQIEGRVSHVNLMQIHQAILKADFVHSNSVTFDLSQLESADTSILALFTHWYKFFSNRQIALKLVGAPAFLLDMIDLFGLKFILNKNASP